MTPATAASPGVSPLLVAVIAGVAAILGAALGAWLNSMLTVRREKWELRRSLYARLLENLKETRDALSLLLYWEETWDPSDKGAEERRRRLQGREHRRVSKAFRQVVTAMPLATVVLPQDVALSLQALETEWRRARNARTFYHHLDEQYAAVLEAERRLIEGARKQLRF